MYDHNSAEIRQSVHILLIIANDDSISKEILYTSCLHLNRSWSRLEQNNNGIGELEGIKANNGGKMPYEAKYKLVVACSAVDASMANN